MWKTESQSVRDEWKRKAEAVKTKHEQDHPNYQYQPRKPSEKKRRMTKRKAQSLAAAANAPLSMPQQPLPNASFNDLVGHSIVDLNGTNGSDGITFEMPTFNISGQEATFTFDPSQENQINLFNEMLENHNSLSMADLMLDAPAASASLPTVTHHNQSSFDKANDAITTAEMEMYKFEETLEAQLANELDELDNMRDQSIMRGYNDSEAQRFTDFLDQMPTDMWGMEFVDYP